MLSETVRSLSYLTLPTEGSRRGSTISNISNVFLDLTDAAAVLSSLKCTKSLNLTTKIRWPGIMLEGVIESLVEEEESRKRHSMPVERLAVPGVLMQRFSSISAVILAEAEAKISTRMAPAARSLRKSLAYFGEMDLLIPFECCCRRLTLIQGTLIVGIVELVFAAILLIQLPEYIIDDGYFWYTQALVGHGLTLFIISLLGIFSCISVTVVMLYGVLTKKQNFLLPHLLWQCLFIFSQFLRVAFILHLLHQEAIIKISAITLIVMAIVPVLVQIWFINVVYSCYQYLNRVRNAPILRDFVRRTSNTGTNMDLFADSPVDEVHIETKLVTNGAKTVRYGSVPPEESGDPV